MSGLLQKKSVHCITVIARETLINRRNIEAFMLSFQRHQDYSKKREMLKTDQLIRRELTCTV